LRSRARQGVGRAVLAEYGLKGGRIVRETGGAEIREESSSSRGTAKVFCREYESWKLTRGKVIPGRYYLRCKRKKWIKAAGRKTAKFRPRWPF